MKKIIVTSLMIFSIMSSCTENGDIYDPKKHKKSEFSAEKTIGLIVGTAIVAVAVSESSAGDADAFAEGFAKLNLIDVVRLLEEVDATFSVVETISDVLEDAHLIENEAIVKVESDNPDYQWTIGNPIEVGGFNKKPPKDGPEIGEHTRDILAEGGFSAEEISNLEQAGVVKQHV